MALRYYPSFRIQANQNTAGGDFTVNKKPYVGKFYLTYDGKAFSGPDPVSGPSEPLTPAQKYQSSPVLTNKTLPPVLIDALASVTPSVKTVTKPTLQQAYYGIGNPAGGPTPYYPLPLENDYARGYIMRYFAKKSNDAGYVVEVSEQEHQALQDGTVSYDVSMYMTGRIMWKLTGPLNSVRLSQYDTRAGIIDTNKRLTESLNVTFLGITDFIGGDYTKWARPTT
jgi:hypothetical protein